MKVTETIERQCCNVAKDLKPVEGSPKIGRFAQFVFCIYCGRRHEYHDFVDAAGARDWDYRPLKNEWEERAA